MARRGHDRALGERTLDAGNALPADGCGRRQTQQRTIVVAQRCASHEVLVATDARILRAVDRIGDDLSLEIELERAVERDHPAIAADQGRIVHHVDRQEAYVFAPCEPVVELARSHRESRDREALELTLAAVAHLAGLVQPHEAAGEHLRVDAVVPAASRGETRDDLARDRTDSGLERRGVGDEAQCVIRDRAAHVVRSVFGQLARRTLALDQQVDLVRSERVRMLGQQAERARKVRARFGHEHALGIGAAAAQLGNRRPCVEREAHAPALPRRRHAGRHHPRRELPRDPLEASEISWDEAHVVSRRAQRALDGTEESG